ncbi:MAG: hypothetical protein LUD68_07490 [Rikenellaceae bacterium]|nr:hypothetical protein [Rikenellaceae bacterium]
MRRLGLIGLFLLLLGGCRSGKNDPEKVAWGFLHAYYANDYQGALNYADQATRYDLQTTLEELYAQGITDEQMKKMARPVIIEIQGIIANDGQRAVCAYKLKNSPDDYNALMETILLSNTEEGWKVSF